MAALCWPERCSTGELAVARHAPNEDFSENHLETRAACTLCAAVPCASYYTSGRQQGFGRTRGCAGLATTRQRQFGTMCNFRGGVCCVFVLLLRALFCTLLLDCVAPTFVVNGHLAALWHASFSELAILVFSWRPIIEMPTINDTLPDKAAQCRAERYTTAQLPRVCPGNLRAEDKQHLRHDCGKMKTVECCTATANASHAQPLGTEGRSRCKRTGPHHSGRCRPRTAGVHPDSKAC